MLMTPSEQPSAPYYRFFKRERDSAPVLPPRSVQMREVIGQCSCCHDLFAVSVFHHQGQLHVSEMASIRVERSPTGDVTIYHRRPTCQGEIKLFGSSP